MWGLIHEVKVGRSCDSLRHELEKEIVLAAIAQIKSDSLLAVKDNQLGLEVAGGSILKERVDNGVAENKVLKQEVKKRGFWNYVLGGVAVVFGIIAISK